jgi:hypothetical protein
MNTSELKYTAAARRWKRYYMHGPIKIINTRNKVRMMSFGQVDDLSEGGLGMYCHQALDVNETVEIEFQIPASKSSLRFLGTVRNSGDGRYGIEFSDLGAHEKEELARACRTLSNVQGR